VFNVTLRAVNPFGVNSIFQPGAFGTLGLIEATENLKVDSLAEVFTFSVVNCWQDSFDGSVAKLSTSRDPNRKLGFPK
jgi:hypothetical protein